VELDLIDAKFEDGIWVMDRWLIFLKVKIWKRTWVEVALILLLKNIGKYMKDGSCLIEWILCITMLGFFFACV